MRERLLKRLHLYVTVIIIGVIYFLFVSISGFGLPCIIKSITGFDCPACGITRMIISILRGDVIEGIKYNLVLPIVIPVLSSVLIRQEVRYIKTGNRNPSRLEKVFCIILIVVLILYGILRNMI